MIFYLFNKKKKNNPRHSTGGLLYIIWAIVWFHIWTTAYGIPISQIVGSDVANPRVRGLLIIKLAWSKPDERLKALKDRFLPTPHPSLEENCLVYALIHGLQNGLYVMYESKRAKKKKVSRFRHVVLII